MKQALERQYVLRNHTIIVPICNKERAHEIFPEEATECSVKKDVIKKSGNLARKGLKARNYIKKIPQRGCSSVNLAKFLRTPIAKCICERFLVHF